MEYAHIVGRNMEEIEMKVTIENYPEKYLEMIYTAGRNKGRRQEDRTKRRRMDRQSARTTEKVYPRVGEAGS